MPAPHALCSKMLAERTASRNVFVLFYFIYFTVAKNPLKALNKSRFEERDQSSRSGTTLNDIEDASPDPHK